MTYIAFLCACSSLLLGVVVPSSARDDGLGAWHMRQKDDRLICRPKYIRAGDILQIKFLAPHGGSAGFYDLKGDFAFVAVDDESPVYVKGIITGNRLSKMSILKIDVAHAVGDRGQYPRKRRIFRDPGVYLFQVSPALDAEDIPPDGECAVRFLGPRARR